MAKTEWKTAKLDELGFVGRGKSRHRPRDAAILYGGPYPFFQTGDIKAANFHLSEYTQTYSEQGLAQSKLWKPGTLCITIAANIAESAILSIEGCFPDSVVGFVADPKKADVRFIKYSMDTLKLQMESASHGTTQDNLSLDKLLTFDFRVPPLSDQRRIADVLSAYDELMENNQRRILVLEATARAIYREWFVEEKFPTQNAKSDLGIKKSTLGKLCSRVRVPFDEDMHAERPLLDLSRIPQRSIGPLEVGRPSELTTSRILFEPGDTLFGAIRCYLHKVVAAHYSGVTNTSVLVFRPRRPSFRSLVALIASDTETIRWADTHSTGTKMPVINGGVLETMLAPLPSDALAQQFEEIVGPMLDQIGVLATQIENLRRTRNLLLPRLLAGSAKSA